MKALNNSEKISIGLVEKNLDRKNNLYLSVIDGHNNINHNEYHFMYHNSKGISLHYLLNINKDYSNLEEKLNKLIKEILKIENILK